MLSKISSLWRHDWVKDIIFLTSGLLIFYLLWLGSYPFFTPDEGRYSEIAREMLATGDYITPKVNGIPFLDKPILHYWLQTTAIKLFGINEWAARFFPALLGIFGCLITYLCSRFLFDRRTGLLSAIILGTTPLYFGGAHYANMDLEVAVFISCTLLLFFTASYSIGKARFYLFTASYIFSSFAFLTKGLIAIAFPGLIIVFWIILFSRWDILKNCYLLPGLLLFLAIILPWQFYVQKANPGFFHYFFITQQITRFLSAAEFNSHEPFWFYIPVLLLGFFPWTIFLFQALYQSISNLWQARNTYQKELFFVLWTVTIFVFFSIPRSKITTYILPIFPALAILVGNYLSILWENAQEKGIYTAVIAFLGLSLIIAYLATLLPRYEFIDITNEFIPYLHFITVTFILSALLACIFIKKQKLLALFTICAISNVIVLLTITLGAPYLNERSTKPLIAALKTIIKPTDEVVAYRRYFYDVPLYLGKRISIVADWNSPDIEKKDNWIREFWYGKAYQNTDDWLINEEQFWELWNSDKRIFVFMNMNVFYRFKSQADRYFFIGKSNDIILISNQMTRLTKVRDSKQYLAELMLIKLATS